MRSVLRRFSDASATCSDALRPAVHALPRASPSLEAELGRDHDLVADRRERFADELFVRERAIGLGGVEERHAALERRADQRDRLGFSVARARSRSSCPCSRSRWPTPRGRSFPVCASACYVILSLRTARRRPSRATQRPWLIAMWVIAVIGVAPCQCFSPGGAQRHRPGGSAPRSAPALHEAAAERDDQDLARRMDVPVGPRTRLERDVGAHRGLRLARLEQRIDAYDSGEVLGGPILRRLRAVPLNLHRRSLLISLVATMAPQH